MALTITTSAFENGKTIPLKNTCDGDDMAPQLRFDGVPGGTVSLSLIMEDPDAPGGIFTHWILYNLPPDTKELSLDHKAKKNLSNGAIQGLNDFNRYGYGGPCPPKGSSHRYFFRLFALNKKLPPESANTRDDFYTAIKGKIIEEAEYMGIYKRNS